MNHRIDKLKSTLESLVDRIGRIWLWLALSLLLLLVVAAFNNMLVASYLWAAAKITMAGAIGYGFDRAAFPGADPRHLDGIERSMAQSRRGVLIAAAMIAAGLIG